jgi:uncharacterized protein YjbJ (UPF0337 family)
VGGLIDKLTGKVKQAAGDIAGRDDLRREGLAEEQKGEKKDELAEAEAKADEKAREVVDLERKTT